MTTAMSPANRQALLQALREDQDFREEARALLLGQELLKLPEQVAALTAQVGSLADQVSNLTDKVAVLTTQVGNLTDQVGSLTAKVDSLTIQTGRLTTRVDGLTTQVGNLQGTALEFQVQGSIHSLIFRRLEFSHAQVLKSQSVQATQSFYDFLWDAVARNCITKEDIGQLLAADLLLRARLPDSSEQVHVAVEVSRTVADDDIVRARERADLLAAAAGTAGQGVVIGVIIPEPQRRLAERMGVAVFQEEEPRP